MIYIAFIISIAANCFFGWYSYNLLKDRIGLVSLFKKFVPVIKKYEANLEALTKMDLYFGDPTIISLVEHTKEVSNALEDLMQSVELDEDDEDQEEEEQNDEAKQ